MPDDIRMKRISAFFQQELARIVSRELKDPVFENKLISFPEISVSRDLSTAQVMVSVLGDQSVRSVVVQALNKAEKLIRHEITIVSDLRRTPVFTFHEDHSMEVASKIDQILNTLDIPPEDESDGADRID
jgi:ribosome-binding factor A